MEIVTYSLREFEDLVDEGLHFTLFENEFREINVAEILNNFPTHLDFSNQTSWEVDGRKTKMGSYIFPEPPLWFAQLYFMFYQKDVPFSLSSDLHFTSVRDYVFEDRKKRYPSLDYKEALKAEVGERINPILTFKFKLS